MDLDVLLPGSDIQLAAVDDARELKQDGKPASDPDPITRSNVHVVTGVFPQGLDADASCAFIELLSKNKHQAG